MLIIVTSENCPSSINQSPIHLPNEGGAFPPPCNPRFAPLVRGTVIRNAAGRPCGRLPARTFPAYCVAVSGHVVAADENPPESDDTRSFVVSSSRRRPRPNPDRTAGTRRRGGSLQALPPTRPRRSRCCGRHTRAGRRPGRCRRFCDGLMSGFSSSARRSILPTSRRARTSGEFEIYRTVLYYSYRY